MEYYNALLVCVTRYKTLAVDDTDILEFLDEFEGCINARYPLLKLNRWLGYIQGVLIERRRTTVDNERNFTRPLLRHLDFKD